MGRVHLLQHLVGMQILQGSQPPRAPLAPVFTLPKHTIPGGPERAPSLRVWREGAAPRALGAGPRRAREGAGRAAARARGGRAGW